MKKTLKKILCVILCFFITLTLNADAAESELSEQIRITSESIGKSADSTAKNLLSDKKKLPAGNSASDWIAMVLAFSGKQDAYNTYLKDLEAYVADCYEIQGSLDEIKATEYHRIALTMLALGGDPTQIQKSDGTMIYLVADGTWDFHGGNPGEQGSNGLIYTLILLNANTSIQEKADPAFIQQMITELLENQEADGGFVLSSSLGTDVDITAMALQALAPYKDQENVQDAIEDAMLWLSEQLSENGTFVSYNSESVESVAQVILALCALEIDPSEAELFIKNGQSLLDSLNLFRLEDGRYSHEINGGSANLVSTYQSLLALEAVSRLRTDGTWIFDFNAYQAPESASGIPVAVCAATAFAAAGVLIAAGFFMKKQKPSSEKNEH